MSSDYYYATSVDRPFETTVERVKEELKKEGFGVLTEIDIQATMKEKLDVDLPPYMILGACNPDFAYRALQAENKIGTMLPCNVIVRDAGKGRTEVAAVDPVASMQAIENDKLGTVAEQVRKSLRRAVDGVERVAG